ncbi:MAG TPA: ATP-binding protein, partial [Stackebrandtia sp.]|uniref:sensor histidine kinase n=1 Tax=Stackebrandtia sp. TaxID=2023065 RepID=UPI002D46381E
LRRSGGDAPPGTDPSPGLDALPALLESFRAGGTAVESTTDGCPRPLSARVQLAAYRIVQEALTNVSKHAPHASAAVAIAYAPSDLTVEVTDDGPGAVELGAGHGLIGMRERALAADGTFCAGPLEGGGFRVRASLPASESDGDT